MLVGKPVIRGARLAVEFVLGLIAQGWPEAEIPRNCHLTAAGPDLTTVGADRFVILVGILSGICQ